MRTLRRSGVVFQHFVSDEELRGQGLSDGQVYQLHRLAQRKGVDLSEMEGPERYRARYTGRPSARQIFDYYTNAIKFRGRGKQ